MTDKKKTQALIDSTMDKMAKTMTEEQEKASKAPNSKHRSKGLRDDVLPEDADKHLE